LTKEERRTFLKKVARNFCSFAHAVFKTGDPKEQKFFWFFFFKKRMPSFPFSERCDADAAMAEEALTRTLDELMLRVI
jgi:hypothetical protein